MKARIVDHREVLAIATLLRSRGYEVIAPFRGRGDDTAFDTVDAGNLPQVQLHVPNPTYPPKRAVLPPIERLLEFRGRDGAMRIEEPPEAPRLAIFGIRSCDLAGLGHLDRFYLGRHPPDPYYERRRKNLFLVNVVCTDLERDVGRDCFCLCTDTGPAASQGFDLQLMDLGGEFMAVAGSAAGEALFSESLFKRGSPAHVERRRAILTDVRRRFKERTRVFVGRSPGVGRQGVGEDLGGDRPQMP